MRKVFLYSMLLLFTCGLFVQDASAGRFGGGRFSSMRSNSMYSRAYQTKRPAQTNVLNRANPGKMQGLFRGMLIGGLLASLFMGHGLGSALISWFFLGAIVLLLLRLFQNKKQNNPFQTTRNNDRS